MGGNVGVAVLKLWDGWMGADLGLIGSDFWCVGEATSYKMV